MEHVDPLAEAGFGTLGPSCDAEDVSPAVLLVPLAAVDYAGNRLGYGRGYYDAAIARLSTSESARHSAAMKMPFAIGVCHDMQLIPSVPAEPHDRPLDAIVTPMQSIVVETGMPQGLTRHPPGKIMRLLFLGDVVGRPGRAAIIDRLPQLRASWRLDVVVVNGENAAGGFGITEAICDDLLNAGADVITLGNHSFDQREALVFIDRQPRLLRPINYPPARQDVVQRLSRHRLAAACW